MDHEYILHQRYLAVLSPNNSHQNPENNECLIENSGMPSELMSNGLVQTYLSMECFQTSWVCFTEPER